jgi:hypothetical protein
MKVRLVCDLRYLNRYTRFDPFPVPNEEEIMNKLASFKFITVFDARAAWLLASRKNITSFWVLRLTMACDNVQERHLALRTRVLRFVAHSRREL